MIRSIKNTAPGRRDGVAIGRSAFSNAERLGECRSPSYFRTLEQNRDVPSFRCRRTIAERARAIVEQPSPRFFDRHVVAKLTLEFCDQHAPSFSVDRPHSPHVSGKVAFADKI